MIVLRRAIPVAVLAALVAIPAAGSTALATGLRGTVTLSPVRPVCIEGQPCSKPAAGVVLRFSANGRLAGRVTTRADGSYRILLGRGLYAVSFTPRSAPRTIAPTRVRVVAGRIVRVDFEIDTGLN